MNATPTPAAREDRMPAGFVELVQKGREALAGGDIESAREIFLTATTRYPLEAVGHNNLGGFYMGLQEHDAAASCFARALELSPESHGTRFNLAVAQFGLGDFEAAAAGFAAVSEANPDDPEALNNLGAACFLAGDHDGARGRFTAALNLNPNFPSAVLNLCDVELASGNREAARDLCEAYLAHHRDMGVLRRLLELLDEQRSLKPRQQEELQARKAEG
jgi:Flp pilus assembly protein TadD